MFYTNEDALREESVHQQMLPIIEETRQEVLEHPDCLSLTTVVTAKGNHYHFINTTALFSGNYAEQEQHIQTLITADDMEVTFLCTMFYPQDKNHIPQPDMPVGYFSQRLLSLHPRNTHAVVPGWGGYAQNGEDVIVLNLLRVVAPPKSKQ